MFTLPQTSYQLRDYQQELIAKIFNCWQSGQRRVLAQMPTGSGKTLVFSAIAAHFVARGERALIIAHRQELLLQARNKLANVANIPIGMIKAGYEPEPEAMLQVGSIQTLSRRRDSLPAASLLIIDEAHHACANSYTDLLQHYKQAYVLGLTATPVRNDGVGFKHIFDDLIFGPDVAELIGNGYLCPYRLFGSHRSIDTSAVDVVAGEFNQKQLGEIANTRLLLGDLVSTWQRHALNRRTVVFAVDVSHSTAIAAAYNELGIPAEHLDGGTETSERVAILERFRQGETLILSNCGIISEGVDIADIEAVQVARPTQSVALWLQMVGRGLRPAPGKSFAIILDHTLNWVTHGLPCDTREWSLEPISLIEDRWSLKCPSCHHVFRPLERKPLRMQQTKLILEASCPVCEVVFEYERGVGGEPPPGRIIQRDESVELKAIQVQANPEILAELQNLKQIQEARGYQKMWIFYRLFDNYHDKLGLIELRECAKMLGFKPGWAWHKWCELQQQPQQQSA